jgi:hypothetical protein
MANASRLRRLMASNGSPALIDYYGIEPILGDSIWKPILEKNGGAFNKMATWK